MLAVAHRFGNHLDDLRVALNAGVDLVEADVHLYRRELEMRHLRTLGPHLLWDEWQLVRRRGMALPGLAAVLKILDGSPRIMLDLKGFSRGLVPRVSRLLQEHSPQAPVTVCSKQWWMLDGFAATPHVRLVLSAGTRPSLRRLRSMLRAGAGALPGGQRAFGVSVRRTLLKPGVVEELHGSVERVLVWPVDTAADLAHAQHLGASGVISRNLRLLTDLNAAG
jgi:hypothetical protein